MAQGKSDTTERLSSVVRHECPASVEPAADQSRASSSGLEVSHETMGSAMTVVHGLPSERSFGRSVGGVILALGAFAWWRGQVSFGGALVLTGALLAGLGTVAPSTLRVPNRLWWRFAQLLGWVNTRILLSIFFVVVLTPVGVVMRWFGRDQFAGWQRDTNWRPYPARRGDPRHYERLF